MDKYSKMEHSLRKFPHSDTDVRFCQSQNARLLSQNKKLMAQLEEMSRKLSAGSNVPCPPVKESSTEADDEDDDDDDVAQRLSVSDRRKRTKESSISSQISELHHDDLEKELEEEKKMRKMAESQRDEALKNVSDLRDNLAKNRAKLKERHQQLSVSNSQQLVNLRLENENLLESLKESSEQLSKLNAENQTLIEEQALNEAQKELIQQRVTKNEETIQNLTMELTEKKCQIDDLNAKLEEGDGSASRAAAENHLLRQEIEHLKGMENSAIVDVDSLKSCGLFHTSSEFRLELTSTEIALWENQNHHANDRLNNNNNNRPNDETTSKSTWKSMTSDVESLKRQSRDGEKRLLKMMKAIEALETERSKLRRRLDETEAVNEELKARVGEATTRSEKREAQMQELLKEVEEKGDELNDVCVDNEKKRKTIEQLTRELTEKNENCERYKRDVADLREEINEKTDTLARIEEKSARVKDQAKSLESINDVLDAEKSRLANELLEKSAEISDLERQLLAKDEDKATTKAHYENLIQELKRTKRESAEHLEAERRKAENINEQRRDMLVEIEGLKNHWEEKIAKRETDVRKLSKLVKKYKEQEVSTAEEARKGQEANEALRKTLEEERKSLRDYEKCYERLEKQIAESEGIVATAKREAAEKESKYGQLLKEKEEESKEREKENRDLRSKMEDLERKLSESRQSLADTKKHLEGKNDAFVEKDAEKRHLERLLKDAKEVLTSQSGTISDLEKKIVEMDAMVKKKTETLKEKEKALESLQSEKQNGADLSDAREAKLKELSDECDVKSREISLKDEEIQRLSAKYAEARSSAERLEQVVADQKREMWQRAAKMKQVDMELQEHRSDTDCAVRKLETALERSLTDLKAKTEEVEKLGGELKAADRMRREMKDAAARAEGNSFVFKERVEELERKFEGDRKLIDELKSEKSALDLKLNLCKDQLAVKQNQLIASNKELQEFQELVSQLEKRVDESISDQRETIHLKKENDDLKLRLSEKEREVNNELNKWTSLVDSNANQHRREVTILEESQIATLAHRDGVISGLRRDLDVKSNEKEVTERLLAESREMIADMKRELRQRTLIVDEANEALTLKDCLIAKLEGRLASLDRLEKMTTATPTRPSVSGKNNNGLKDFNSNARIASKRTGNDGAGISPTEFLDVASSLGVAPLSGDPITPPSPRVRFDSFVREKEITPKNDLSATTSSSPRTSSPRLSYLTLSPPRFSPPSSTTAYVKGLIDSPPIPASLQPTPVSEKYPAPYSSSHYTRSTTTTTDASSLPSPPRSAASDLDVRFKGVIQYLKDNGKCDDELEEISREMKDTLKRSMNSPSPKSTTAHGGGGGSREESYASSAWRQSMNSTMGSTVMEAEMESAEKQLRDLEVRLRANAAQRADIDAQLHGFKTRKSSS